MGRAEALLGLAVVISLPPTYGLGRWLADHIAARGATALVGIGQHIEQRLPDPPVALPPAPEAELAPSNAEATAAGAGEPAASRPTAGAPLPAPMGLLVRRARVLEAVRAGHRPSGQRVPATSFRSAGMALTGVGATGSGLRDGDVVTRVGGSPALSEGAVIAAVSAALQRGDRAISAEVWRGRQRIVVTVELPRVRSRAER